jgi:DNA polymerase III alpha subunit
MSAKSGWPHAEVKLPPRSIDPLVKERSTPPTEFTAGPCGYVELHCHSAFSFLEAASHPDELVLKARELGYPALALTDHDGLHGAMEFAQAARNWGLKPITGAELTLEGGHHLTLLARTTQGYHNLCRLISYAHMKQEKGKPLISLAELEKHNSGLIALSGCKKGEVPSSIDRGDFAAARAVARRFRDWFGRERFYIELQQNLVFGDAGRIEALVRLAAELELDYVATNNAHYHLRSRHQLQDVMVAIKNRTTLDASHQLRRENSEYYLKSVAEMQELFAGHPEAISNTLAIAESIEFDLTKDLDYTFPDHPVPDGYDVDSWLEKICYESAARKYGGNIRPGANRGTQQPVGAGQALAQRSEEDPLIDPPGGHASTDEQTNTRIKTRFKTASQSDTRIEKPTHESPRKDAIPVEEGVLNNYRPIPNVLGTPSPTARTRPALPKLHPNVEERLQQELRLIKKHELSGFFLIYMDLMAISRRVADEVRGKHPTKREAHNFSLSGSPRGAKRTAGGGEGHPPKVEEVRSRQFTDQLPPGRGRGSSVGSIVCYLIGLSHVDPLQHNLFVGRFLNEELRSVPDIDLDFARDIREELILSVYKEFGHENAALVCTYPTYRTRSAIREVGKALGLPLPELDKLAKLSEHYSANEVYEEMALYPEFRSKIDAPLWRDLVRLSYEIAGMPRHTSQHVGGMVITGGRRAAESAERGSPSLPGVWGCPPTLNDSPSPCRERGSGGEARPIIELVPVEKATMPGRVICQWDKDGVDDAGFIKIDFLALGMLSLVDECLELIEERRGKRVDLSRIDFQDEKVYDDICAGDTVGVFQIESRAQIQTLPRTRPRNIDDLAVEVAIIRPGPIVGGAVNPYIKRRQGKEPVTYDHPSLEECLKETLGVVLFQEQVLQVSMALAGFSAGQAESLRRAMSRKRSRDAMASLWEQFLAGCRERGVSDEVADSVFKKLMGFAEFGFPKSHAAAFALLAYQSAWLKRYYPAEFFCALYNAQPMGFYPPHVLTNDARRHGIEILRPDVNKSFWRCTVEQDAVRIGLRYVQGIGEQYEQAIDSARDSGEYRSVRDFCQRTGLRREAIENLIAVGGFDAFGLKRRELLWHLGLVYPQAASESLSAAAGPGLAGGVEGGNLRKKQTKLPLVIRDGEGNLYNPYFGWPLSADQAARAARLKRRQERALQLPLSLPVEQDMVELSEMNPWERLTADYNLLHLSPDSHPLRLLRPLLNEGIASSRHIEALPDETIVEMAGLVVTRQRPSTAGGFIFLLLEDEFGLVNVVVKPDVYKASRAETRMEPFLLVKGEIQHKEGTINLIAQRIRPILLREKPLAPAARSWA